MEFWFALLVALPSAVLAGLQIYDRYREQRKQSKQNDHEAFPGF